MLKHQNKTHKKSGTAGRWVTIALAAGMMAFPVAAVADDAVIWGRQTGLGKFDTKKVNLTLPATVTSATYEGAGTGFCVWSGVPYPEVVVCWNTGDATLVGYVLPADQGYFAIPAKRTTTSPAYVQLTVAY